MPDLAIPYPLAEAGRQFLQGALCLLLLSTPLLGMSLFLAHYLRRRGNFAAASTIQRLSILGLLAGPLLLACLTYAGNPFGRQAVRSASPTPPAPLAPAVSLAIPSAGASGQVWLPVEQRAPALPDFSGWYVGLTLVWVGGSVVLLLGLALSYAYLARFWSQARPLPPDSPAMQRLAALLAASDWAPSRKAPILLTHPRVTIPFAARLPLLPPAIFLPSDPILVLTEEEALSAVLAHELSHLLRNDPGWNLLLRIAWAALWPQPLLWRQLHQMSTIQELACDQTALHLTRGVCRPHVFATSLVNLADQHLFPAWMSQATAAMASHRPLIEERVHHIMENAKASAQSVAPLPCLSVRAHIGMVVGTATLLVFGLGSAVRLSSAAALPAVPAQDSPSADSVSGNTPPTLKRLTLDLRDTPILDALSQAFRQAGLRCEIDPSFQQGKIPAGRVTMKCVNYSASQIFLSILRSSSHPGQVRYRINGDVAHILPVELGADGLPAQRITLNYPRNTPLNTVLQDLSAETGILYSPFSLAPTVTTHVRVNGVPFRTALETVLRNASRSLTYKPRTDDAIIRLIDTTPLPPPVVIPGDENGTGLPDTRITVGWEDAPLRTALEQVFQQMRLDYSLDNGIASNVTVTGKWENQPLRVVLPALLRQSPLPLTYTVENNVIIVRPRPQQ